MCLDFDFQNLHRCQYYYHFRKSSKKQWNNIRTISLERTLLLEKYPRFGNGIFLVLVLVLVLVVRDLVPTLSQLSLASRYRVRVQRRLIERVDDLLSTLQINGGARTHPVKTTLKFYNERTPLLILSFISQSPRSFVSVMNSQVVGDFMVYYDTEKFKNIINIIKIQNVKLAIENARF